MRQANQRLRKLFALSRVERTLLLEAFFTLPWMVNSLELRGFKYCYRQIQLASSDSPRRCVAPDEQRLYAERAAYLVKTAARYGVQQGNCLSQSLTLWRLLVRAGIEAKLRIGARRGATGFEAHAWVEFQGRPINDREDVGATFPPFAAMPELDQIPIV